MQFDLIVLGGGPAGYLAAERAGAAGLKTALVEERSLGGVCLNEGCIPTKTLLYAAKLYDGARLGQKYGITAPDISLDHQAVVKRKDKVVKTLVAGVKSTLRSAQVEVFSTRGEVTGKQGDNYTVVAGEQTLSSPRLLIATGSKPAIPPIPGLAEALDRGFAVTSREILHITTPPKQLCIIGGGVIGLEFAGYFNSIGSKVTVIEMMDHIAGENDQELVALLKTDMEKKGITFHLNAQVTAIEDNSVRFTQDNDSKSIICDLALLSIGRRANTQGLGLETIGLATNRGGIMVDEHLLTNQPGVYAAGDVTGFSMLAHTAYREAEVAVNHMLNIPDRMRYDAIPAVLYTNPELASVGETEKSALDKTIPHQVVKLPMRFSGRYLAENEGGTGICKMIINPQTQKVLGVAALANYASEFIIAAGTWIEMGLTVQQIQKLVFPHPTVGEILREAVFQVK